jgi:hypothetical protein
MIGLGKLILDLGILTLAKKIRRRNELTLGLDSIEDGLKK